MLSATSMFREDSIELGQVVKLSAFDKLMLQIQVGVNRFRQMDDPNNMYAHCMCNINK